MANAVVTRRDGDVFQARLFWIKAANLLDDERRVVRVGFENGPKGFDDVWVEYAADHAPQDQFGQPLLVERMQCKWHATPGTFTSEDLTKPEFINASSTSLLQRALAAYKQDQAAAVHSRLALVTNHRVDQADVLHGMLRLKSFTVDLPKFFDGKEKSKAAKARRIWREHLELDHDDELQALVARLGLHQAPDSLDQLRERLDEACRSFGLVRPLPSSPATIYDTNVFEWVGQGRMEFDRDSLRAKCEQEGLLAPKGRKMVAFGVKSFEHAFDRLEDRCSKVLNLVPAFDERQIRNAAAWRDALLPELRGFLAGLPVTDGRLRLALDAHATLAFAAGSVLNTKSGRLVEIEQRTPNLTVWAPDDSQLQAGWPKLIFRETAAADGRDIYCGVSLSRQVEPQVKVYLQGKGFNAGLTIFAEPDGGPSQTAVRSGAHAAALAEQLAMKLQEARVANGGRAARVHLFVAAPNGFSFELGRHCGALGQLTLYEYDFEGHFGGGYTPSLSLP